MMTHSLCHHHCQLPSRNYLWNLYMRMRTTATLTAMIVMTSHAQLPSHVLSTYHQHHHHITCIYRNPLPLTCHRLLVHTYHHHHPTHHPSRRHHSHHCIST